MDKVQRDTLEKLDPATRPIVEKIWLDDEVRTLRGFVHTTIEHPGEAPIDQWALPALDGQFEHYITHDVEDGWRVSPWAPTDAMQAREFSRWVSEVMRMDHALTILRERFGSEAS